MAVLALDAILELEVHPNANPGVLGAGDYRLSLVVVAADVPAKTATFEFSVPEAWTADQRLMQEAVNVRGLPTTSPLDPLFPELSR